MFVGVLVLKKHSIFPSNQELSDLCTSFHTTEMENIDFTFI